MRRDAEYADDKTQNQELSHGGEAGEEGGKRRDAVSIERC